MKLPWARGRRVDADIDQAIANVTWRKPPARAVTSPPPAPGIPFTAGELRSLANYDQWAATRCDQVRLTNAAMLADLFRGAFPELADDQLGRLLINVSWVAAEFARGGTPGRLPGTLGLAAAELTRLTRNGVPL